MFDSNHIVMDTEILCIRKSKVQKKVDEKGAIQRYHSLKETYLEVVNSSSEEKVYKGTHLKDIITFTKQKNDKVISTHVVDLKVRYEEVKNRSK